MLVREKVDLLSQNLIIKDQCPPGHVLDHDHDHMGQLENVI